MLASSRCASSALLAQHFVFVPSDCCPRSKSQRSVTISRDNSHMPGNLALNNLYHFWVNRLETAFLSLVSYAFRVVTATFTLLVMPSIVATSAARYAFAARLVQYLNKRSRRAISVFSLRSYSEKKAR